VESSAVLAELAFSNSRVFQAVRGDLLEEPVDAIVNAANGMLAHGGGVAGIISRAAGPALQEESDRIVRERGPLATGSAAATTAGKLPFKAVIHAVGPRLGEGDEEAKLVRALESAFRLADERGYASLSFPAVSSGIFAVPVETCARAYIAAVRGWFGGRPASSLARIRLCMRDRPIIGAVLAELGVKP
jgi:O-acetyl-ADP-ribose deacetylase (regulator of RNase III)